MRGGQLSCDVISLNAAISSCEKGLRWEVAISLFWMIHIVRVLPDVVSYNAVISSVEKGRQWQLSLTLIIQDDKPGCGDP